MTRHCGLFLPKHQIHHPASANVRHVTATVVQYVGVVAAGILECVGKNGHEFKGTILVDAFGKGNDIRREPRGSNRDGATGVAEHTSKVSN